MEPSSLVGVLMGPGLVVFSLGIFRHRDRAIARAEAFVPWGMPKHGIVWYVYRTAVSVITPMLLLTIGVAIGLISALDLLGRE